MSKKLNILLIAYHFYPERKVGALRASYWYRNLPSKIDGDIEVITANENSSGDKVHFVPVKSKTLLSSFIKDPGLLWKDNVMSFLKEKKDINPDIVIITGGPFMHFALTNWLKIKYNCKVILDYRDPFAVNPGFNNNSLQVIVKKYFERKFNRNADALITVNKYCAEIIELFDQKKNAIIQNGFDENVEIEIKEPNLTGEINLVYTGKFYFSPIHLIKAIEKKEFVLNYYGADGDRINEASSNIFDHGLVSYDESIRAIALSDVGIIQTYGEDFQSTTKLFDYLRCKKPILIISDRYMNRGSIYDELKDYPNVFWSENNEFEIEKTLEKIRNHNYKEPEDDFVNKFSRGRQMDKLIHLIKEINETI